MNGQWILGICNVIPADDLKIVTEIGVKRKENTNFKNDIQMTGKNCAVYEDSHEFGQTIS